MQWACQGIFSRFKANLLPFSVNFFFSKTGICSYPDLKNPRLVHFSNSREPQAKLYPISYVYDIYFYIHVSIFIYSSICLSMYLLIYCHFYRLCLCVYLWIHMFSFSLLCFNLYLWLHSSISSDNILHKKCSLYIVRVEKKTWQRYNHHSVGLWWKLWRKRRQWKTF